MSTYAARSASARISSTASSRTRASSSLSGGAPAAPAISVVLRSLRDQVSDDPVEQRPPKLVLVERHDGVLDAALSVPPPFA